MLHSADFAFFLKVSRSRFIENRMTLLVVY